VIGAVSEISKAALWARYTKELHLYKWLYLNPDSWELSGKLICWKEFACQRKLTPKLIARMNHSSFWLVDGGVKFRRRGNSFFSVESNLKIVTLDQLRNQIYPASREVRKQQGTKLVSLHQMKLKVNLKGTTHSWLASQLWEWACGKLLIFIARLELVSKTAFFRGIALKCEISSKILFL